MSKFHSTISRRDFMKGLGLAGAGLGAAAAATPVFHDLDEIMSSGGGSTPQVAEKRPWWVKEREYLNPVTEIDWNVMQRFSHYNHDQAHLTPEEWQRRWDRRLALRKEQVAQNSPGNTLRDRALCAAGFSGQWWQINNDLRSGINTGFLGEKRHFVMGDAMGLQQSEWLPRWEGTPEENCQMLRVASRFFGGGTVGFGEMIEGKTKKLTFAEHGMVDKGIYVFEDVDEPYQVPFGKNVIPNKYRYVLLCNLNEDITHERMSPSNLMGADIGKAYDQGIIFAYRMNAFIQALGWGGICDGYVGGSCMRPAWGEIGGMGEVGRIHHLITPEYGPGIRYTCVTYTDLPLIPTNPIEFGASRFCETCTKCRDLCPNLAIQGGERTWDITPADATEGNPDHLHPERFNQPGKKIWWFNHFACRQAWEEMDNPCNICTASCVFSKERISSIHEFVKPVVSMTPLFNGFFFNMDKAFGYGALPEERWEDFWTKDHPIVGTNY